MSEHESYSGWAVVELMGHRRLAGQVSQVTQYGTAMLRLDIPGKDGPWVTQFYGGASIYAVTPVSEEIGREVAVSLGRVQPVTRWELARLLPSGEGPADIEGQYDNGNPF